MVKGKVVKASLRHNLIKSPAGVDGVVYEIQVH